ncbi:MAG: hypothetical protein IIA65_04035 [Planctomycetes bacterium]|nr:hypothetical protein [Planctomycetota bacterium]
MTAKETHSKSASQDRLRIVLIVVVAPIVLVFSLSGVGLVHSYNIFCWNGIDRTHYGDGQIELETTYRGGLRHGRQTKYHPNGQKMFECKFQEGKLQGLHSSWDSKGRLEEETEYAQGKMHGTSTLFDSKGQTSSVDTFNHGVKERSVHYDRTADDTRKYEAEYRNGRPWSGKIVRYVAGRGFKIYTYDEGKLVGY